MGIGSEPGWLMAWERLMVTHAEVIRRLEADLLAQHKLSLTWFDAMSVLELAPEHRIPMHKMADAVLITRSGLTRVADQLEEQGFVVRVPLNRGSAHGLADAYRSWPSEAEGGLARPPREYLPVPRPIPRYPRRRNDSRSYRESVSELSRIEAIGSPTRSKRTESITSTG